MSFSVQNRGALLRTAALAGLGILLTWPALIYGFPEITDDAVQHVLYITPFSKQFWAGDLYPRWLSEMNAGLGSPTFFYYPPLSYFITSFMPSWVDSEFGWGAMGVAACVAVILSGVCMYRWLRELVDPTPALAAALLYMLMPYHVAVDLYTRGAFAELWGFVWMPLLLFFTVQVARDRPYAMVALALTYAALSTTHLPTTVIFSAVPITYAAFTRVSGKRRTVLVKVGAAMLLGVGVAAIYLLPALGMRSYVHIEQATTTGYFYYENWFLFSKLKLWGDETAKLSVMVLFVVVPMMCGIYLALPNRAVRRDLILYTAISAIAIFMMVPASKPIWKLLPMLQRTQFPYRINTLVSVSAAALLAFGFSSLSQHKRRVRVFLLAVIFACVCVWILATVFAAKSAFLRFNPLPEYAAQVDRRLSLTFGGWEFWPSHTDIKAEEQTLMKVVNGELSPPARVVEGQGSVLIEEWRPRRILLKADLQTDSIVHVNQLYFPGWTAEVVGQGAFARVQPSEVDGLVSITLPAGSYPVSLKLEPGGHERAGQVISAVAALLLLTLFVREYWKGRSSR